MKRVSRADVRELQKRVKTPVAPMKFKIRWHDDTEYTPEPGSIVLKWPDDPALTWGKVREVEGGAVITVFGKGGKTRHIRIGADITAPP